MATQPAPVWGGVYVGPATDSNTSATSQSAAAVHQRAVIVSPTSDSGLHEPKKSGSLVERLGSLRKRGSQKGGSQKKLKEETSVSSGQIEQAWGGVYVGPSAARLPMAEVKPLNNEADAACAEGEASAKAVSKAKNITSSISASFRAGKVKCEACKKKCTGDVLKADERFFHVACFACKVCQRSLGDVGFFEHGKVYYCPDHYHEKFGSRCGVCDKFVEGDVVTVMGKTYHTMCFKCDRCKQSFPSGQKVTFTGREHLCQKCLHIPVAKVKPTQHNGSSAAPPPEEKSPEKLVKSQTQTPVKELDEAPRTVCSACGELVQSGQVLLALDQQFHIWCFRCAQCDGVLHGEYMTKDSRPYCIRDYNARFGTRCDACTRYIAGKVLQAGDFCFHPACARCSRCMDVFADGEEMYMQDDEIWHPRCNDFKLPDKSPHTNKSTTLSMHSTVGSHSLPLPHGVIRPLGQSRPYGDFGKHLTYSYLLPEPEAGYLRQPLQPRPTELQQFHKPPEKPIKIRRSRAAGLQTGMQRLAKMLEENEPRPHSPFMNSEEPIEMAHFPSGTQPSPEKQRPIERDDFPAPPYPYAVEEIRRRYSIGKQEDLGDEDDEDVRARLDKIERQEELLKRIAPSASIATVFIHDLEEKARQAKLPQPVDPRSKSRTANAKRAPTDKCRYDTAINASPSRYVTRPRPWEHWEQQSRAATAVLPCFHVPRPGYGLQSRAATLPPHGVLHNYYELGFDELEAAPSQDLTEHSYPVDGHWSQASRRTYQPRGIGTYSGQPMPPLYSTASPYLRTSLPDMSKPLKTYTYEEITTQNKRLPEDVDRCHLERHLAKQEFEELLGMTPIEFYKLPDWRRIQMKRRLKLF